MTTFAPRRYEQGLRTLATSRIRSYSSAMTALADIDRPEPRWPAMIAAFAAVALHYALPPELRFGPPGALAFIVAILVLAAQVARHRGMHRANEFLGYGVLVVLTGGLVFGVAALLNALLHGSAKAPALLKSATVLWTTNVIVFASWYWRLDAGGPNQRDLLNEHLDGAFLFPQMVMDAETKEAMGEVGWRPGFIDYLFLAFNSSAAFSPTDSPVLSRWAKLVMMIQSSISLTTIAVIAARAINIL